MLGGEGGLYPVYTYMCDGGVHELVLQERGCECVCVCARARAHAAGACL